MLQEVSIKNLAIIEKASLNLKAGMTVITGPTGAGKSVIIDAILLGLGQRIKRSINLDNGTSCEITLVFSIVDNPSVISLLQEHDLHTQEQQLIVRRVFKTGISKSYVNDRPVTNTLLKSLTKLLVSLHGQHDNRLLLESKFQLQTLDSFAKHHHLLAKLIEAYQQWSYCKQLLDTQLSEVNTSDKQALLNFQIAELKQVSITANELERLEKRHKQLANSEQMQDTASHIIDLLSNDTNGIQTKIEQVIAAQLDDSNISLCMEQASINIQEALDSAKQLRQEFESNPEELASLNQQLQQLYALAKKHQVAPSELQQLLISKQQLVEKLASSEQVIFELRKDLELKYNNYQNIAKQLSKSRQQSASELATKVSKFLKKLGITGLFSIQIEYQDDKNPTPSGLDDISFMVQTNTDTPLGHISKVASGGEISRISLALQTALGDNLTIPTIIFDEVDIGISGATASIVGSLLKETSKNRQLISITHLAQVAAMADNHLCINKATTNGTTKASVTNLDHSQRIQELGRIIGGATVSATTLQQAEELIQTATTDT